MAQWQPESGNVAPLAHAGHGASTAAQRPQLNAADFLCRRACNDQGHQERVWGHQRPEPTTLRRCGLPGARPGACSDRWRLCRATGERAEPCTDACCSRWRRRHPPPHRAPAARPPAAPVSWLQGLHPAVLGTLLYLHEAGVEVQRAADAADRQQLAQVRPAPRWSLALALESRPPVKHSALLPLMQACGAEGPLKVPVLREPGSRAWLCGAPAAVWQWAEQQAAPATRRLGR